VRGLARATGGAAEFISAGERIEDKVLRTFGRLNSPAATGVTIDWDGCDVQTLAELPPVFDGDVMTVFGRAPGRLPGKVTLSCRTPRGPRQWAVAVPPAAADDGGVIATMWARRMIQSLEEVNHVASTRYRHRKASRPTETLIGLSKEFGLLCSLTTFIAIEHRSPEERNDGRPALRRVPVMLAEGWGGIAGGGASHLDCLVAAPVLSARTTIDKTLDRRDLYDLEDQSCDVDRASREVYSKRGARSFRESVRDSRSMKRASAAPEPSDELQGLLASLSAQGAFEAGRELDAMLTSAGRDPDWWREVIGHSIPVAAGGLPHRDAIVTTVMVLLLLRDRFAAREPMWRRAAGKALGYLARAVGHGAEDVRAWMKELEGKLLSPEPARP
jgi:Ca-activated chloride channel family protein